MTVQEKTLWPKEIKEQYHQLKKENPKLRARDLATEIGISEAQLVAARVTEKVTNLQTNWKEMFAELESLGKVMALTRNEHAVHERNGVYSNSESEAHGIFLFVNPDVDLRIFLRNWAFGFAVEEQTRSGLRKSLQFFGKDGKAIHKIYLLDESNHKAYEQFVDRFRSTNQGFELEVVPTSDLAVDLPDEEIDLKGLRKKWEDMQDTHDFYMILREFKVGRVQALRMIGEDFSYQVKPESFRKILNLASDKECGIMVFVGNPGCIQIHTGPVNNLKEFGPWYNVLDSDFNLHLREDRIGSAWVVKKPTEDGIVTALELYDHDNQNIALLFGKRKPGIPELELWREIIDQLERV